MVVVSYFAVVSYSRSINLLTDNYLTQLVQRIAEQTDDLGVSYYNHLNLISKYPFIQLSFLRYPLGGQLPTNQEKLEHFRKNSSSFDQLTLFTNYGEIVTATPQEPNNTKHQFVMPKNGGWLADNYTDYFQTVNFSGEYPMFLMYKAVYDYRDFRRLVGYVSAEIDLTKLLSFTQQLDIEYGISKSIITDQGDVIYRENTLGETMGQHAKEFSANLPFLKWNVNIAIPRHLLLSDVNRLSLQLVGFAALVALIAATTSLLISNIVIKPVKDIINGIKEFATGNLAYRFRNIRGNETQRVAEAFNMMADDLQKRQEELVQSDKLASLGLLSAGFAHEVRNPLAGIKTASQVLAKRSSSTETKNLAVGISKEVDRLNKIVGDLLHFSRPKPTEKRVCDIYDLVDQSVTILAFEVSKKGVKIINDMQSHQVFIVPGQLIQIFINLTMNALNAVDEKNGVIRFTSRMIEDDELVVSVSDNGHGIPQEKVGRIFDPFFSLSRQGTGLGLTVVQLLLGQNDLHVNVKSNENKGTTFTLHFKGKSLGQSSENLNTRGIQNG